MTFYLWRMNLQKYYFCLASWRSLTKRAWSGSGSVPKCHWSGTLSITFWFWQALLMIRIRIWIRLFTLMQIRNQDCHSRCKSKSGFSLRWVYGAASQTKWCGSGSTTMLTGILLSLIVWKLVYCPLRIWRSFGKIIGNFTVSDDKRENPDKCCGSSHRFSFLIRIRGSIIVNYSLRIGPINYGSGRIIEEVRGSLTHDSKNKKESRAKCKLFVT